MYNIQYQIKNEEISSLLCQFEKNSSNMHWFEENEETSSLFCQIENRLTLRIDFSKTRKFPHLICTIFPNFEQFCSTLNNSVQSWYRQHLVLRKYFLKTNTFPHFWSSSSKSCYVQHTVSIENKVISSLWSCSFLLYKTV